MFHAKLAEKEGLFTFDDVVKGVSDKMINRHPHVFADGKAGTPSEVLDTWEDIKKKEKKYKDDKDVLESIPDCLPALMRAEKLVGKGEKLRGKKVDFKESVENAIKNLKALEWSENDDKGQISDEIGEILFEIVKISRFFKINPEFVLTNRSEKFITNFRRFND